MILDYCQFHAVIPKLNCPSGSDSNSLGLKYIYLKNLSIYSVIFVLRRPTLVWLLFFQVMGGLRGFCVFWLHPSSIWLGVLPGWHLVWLLVSRDFCMVTSHPGYPMMSS